MRDLPLVGDEFAGYRLVAVLMRGGMSTVYRAENPRLGNVIALKVMASELADDDVFRARFLAESRIAAGLNHPNVVPIHDSGSSDGLLYIAMRYVTGIDLRQMLSKRGRLPPETAVFLLSQAARALDAAHRRGLVHRDVKPGNLLIERASDDADPDHVYLTDFGITKHAAERTGLTATGQFIGTVDYIAPEQVRGLPVLGTADQYSLACVLYECLTGRVPFERDMDAAIIWAHVQEHPTHPTMLRPDLPPEVDEVFARALAKQPGGRYGSCREFMTAAREALGRLADPPGAGQRPHEGSSGAEPGLLPAVLMPAEPPWPGPERYLAGVGEHPAYPVAPHLQQRHPAEVAHEPADVRGDGTESTPGLRDLAESDALAAWQGVASPPAPEAEPAGNRSAMGVPYGPTQSVLAVGGGDWGGTRSPESMPQGTGPDPGGGRLPPGGATGPPARRPAWPRLSVLLLVAAAALAVPIALVVMASAKSNTGGASVTTHTGGATRTGAAGTATSAPSLAIPTVAGKIQVGQTPSYIQVAPNGKFAYIANPGAGAITVLNTADDLVSGTISIPQGPPQFASFSPDSRTAYVSVYNTRGSVHLVAFIDTATGTVTSTVPVDNYTPGPSATSPDGRYLYVPNHNMAMSGAPGENVIDVIDTVGKKLMGSIAVPPNPHWIVFGKNGRFYATDHMSTTVTVLNAHNNGIIAEIEVGETPHSEALSPDGSRLAVTSFNGNEVFLVNTATDQEIARIPVGRNPLDIAYSPDGRYLFTADNEDNTVTVIDTADNRVIAEVPTGKAPTSISVLPNGRHAYVSDENDGTIEILNIAK